MHYGKSLISVFQEFFVSIDNGGTGHRAIILWGLDTFSKFLSRSATRKVIAMYHVYN